MITINNKKLTDWIVMKDELVTKGRSISKEIEKIEKKTHTFELMEKRLTGKIVPPKDLTDRGDAIVKEVTKLQTELTKIANEINKSKLDAVPEKMKNEHLQLLKDKEVLERDRNKVALKVQKIKDRIVPLVQKEVKPLICAEKIQMVDIGKFDDIETAKVKDGEVVISTFNHLTDFMAKFK